MNSSKQMDTAKKCFGDAEEESDLGKQVDLLAQGLRELCSAIEVEFDRLTLLSNKGRG